MGAIRAPCAHAVGTLGAIAAPYDSSPARDAYGVAARPRIAARGRHVTPGYLPEDALQGATGCLLVPLECLRVPPECAASSLIHRERCRRVRLTCVITPPRGEGPGGAERRPYGSDALF